MSESRRKLTEEERKHVPFSKFVRESDKAMSLDERYKTYNEEERLANIKRLEERNKEMIKAKKKEQKRMIYEQAQLLRSLADNEGKDAAKYRDLAKYNPLPTMSKLFFSLALEEHEHEVRLVRLAEELTRKIL